MQFKTRLFQRNNQLNSIIVCTLHHRPEFIVGIIIVGQNGVQFHKPVHSQLTWLFETRPNLHKSVNFRENSVLTFQFLSNYPDYQDTLSYNWLVSKTVFLNLHSQTNDPRHL